MRSRPADAVILAAGEARRAGDFKLAWPIGGIPVLVRVVRIFQPVAKRIIVVTGFRPERVRALLAGEPGVTFAHNARYRDGMFTSVQTGLTAATAGHVFLTPGDIPMVSRPVLRALMEADGAVRVPVFRHRTGHPVLLTEPVREAVVTAPPDTTLRDVLRAFHRTEVPVDCEGILLDIDTASDYNELQERYEHSDF